MKKPKTMRFYTLKQTAALLNVHERTIHNYIASRRLDAEIVGGQYRIFPEAIQEFCDSQKAKRTWNVLKKKILLDIDYNRRIYGGNYIPQGIKKINY